MTAITRLKKLTFAQFYSAAQAGNLAIDAVLADIKDVVELASQTDTSRAETAAANARAEALGRERDETVLGSMLDIYRQRAEVDADQMAKLEAKLAKAVEALKPFAAMGRQWQTTAKGLVDAETLRAMTYPVDWLAAASTITEIEGKSK